MRREEEIKEVAGTYAIDEVKDTCNPASKRGLLYVGFIDGALWADQHPHWISVEESKPKLIENKLLWDYSDDVLVYLKDGSITVGRWERDNSTGEQYWLLDIDKDVIVTHWMPMPQIPKEGGAQ